jgi:hypothetical protein
MKNKKTAIVILIAAILTAFWINHRTPSAPEKAKTVTTVPIVSNHMLARHAVKPGETVSDTRSVTEKALNECGLTSINSVRVSAVADNINPNQPQP